MSRYIDADALIEELQHCSYLTWSKDINRAWWAQAVKVKDNIINCIERQPTADVVGVRHGYWYIREYEFFTCSECGHDYWNGCDYTIQAKERLANGEHPNYCPNCGAKMDSERREE